MGGVTFLLLLLFGVVDSNDLFFRKFTRGHVFPLSPFLNLFNRVPPPGQGLMRLCRRFLNLTGCN